MKWWSLLLSRPWIGHSRPIDEVSTWVQYGEAVCWVVADYETCCAPEHGPLGNPSCWIAPPLSFETCCLERWQVCDVDLVNQGDLGELDGSIDWVLFYQACAVVQEVLNSLHKFWIGTALRAQLCNVDVQACHQQSEVVEADWRVFETQRTSLSNRARWLEIIDTSHTSHLSGSQKDPSAADPLVSPDLCASLDQWPPEVFVTLLDFVHVSTSESGALQALEQLHRDLEGFRDAMLDALYSKQISQLDQERRKEESLGSGNSSGSKSAEDGLPLRKEVNCHELLHPGWWESSAFKWGVSPETRTLVPPPSIPPGMRDQFTMQGRIPVISHSATRRALGFVGGKAPKEEVESEWAWSWQAIEDLIRRAYNYQLAPGPTSFPRVKGLTEVLADLPSLLQEQHWVVWGDNKHFEWWKPWMEALLLSFGARSVTSIVPKPERYNNSLHPQLTPLTLEQAILEAPFHGLVLMGSSTAGLGRHGDMLHPNADLQQAQVAWCLLRSRGILIAPAMQSADMLRWPLGRVYGPVRWPHLVANFQLLRVYEHAAVLQKP